MILYAFDAVTLSCYRASFLQLFQKFVQEVSINQRSGPVVHLMELMSLIMIHRRKKATSYDCIIVTKSVSNVT